MKINKKKGISIRSYADIFDGEFATSRRIFTTHNGILWVYKKGHQRKTIKKADMSERIKTEVMGL